MATEIERLMKKMVRSLGFDVIEEKEFPPYRVDLYCPELHTAFEADGPHHRMQRKRDLERDGYLVAQFGLVVFRADYRSLNTVEGREQIKNRIAEEASGWAESTPWRVEIAHTNNPEGWE